MKANLVIVDVFFSYFRLLVLHEKINTFAHLM